MPHDPHPCPDQSRPWWGSMLLTVVLFALSLSTQCVQRDRQSEELKRQGREIGEIKALLAERRTPRE
jgi:hypothetical protein